MLMHEYLITVSGATEAGDFTQTIRHATAAKGSELAAELLCVANEPFYGTVSQATILNVFDCGEIDLPEPGPES